MSLYNTILPLTPTTCVYVGLTVEPKFSEQTRNTDRRRAQTQGLTPITVLCKTTSGYTQSHPNPGRCRIYPIVGTHVAHTIPGTRSDVKCNNSDKIVNSWYETQSRRQNKHMQIQGRVAPARILENACSTEAPENGPTANAKIGVNSKTVFWTKCRRR